MEKNTLTKQVRIDAKMHQKLKVIAARSGMPIGSLLDGIIERWFKSMGRKNIIEPTNAKN